MKTQKTPKPLEQHYDAAFARAERDNVQVIAARFAQGAKRAARESWKAAEAVANLAPLSARAKSAEAQRAQGAAPCVVAYAEQAVQLAIHAATSAKAVHPFVPRAGDLAEVYRARRAAVFAWLPCPESQAVKLAVLHARVERAEAAVQAALLVPALASSALVHSGGTGCFQPRSHPSQEDA